MGIFYGLLGVVVVEVTCVHLNVGLVYSTIGGKSTELHFVRKSPSLGNVWVLLCSRRDIAVAIILSISAKRLILFVTFVFLHIQLSLLSLPSLRIVFTYYEIHVLRARDGNFCMTIILSRGIACFAERKKIRTTSSPRACMTDTADFS